MYPPPAEKKRPTLSLSLDSEYMGLNIPDPFNIPTPFLEDGAKEIGSSQGTDSDTVSSPNDYLDFQVEIDKNLIPEIFINKTKTSAFFSIPVKLSDIASDIYQGINSDGLFVIPYEEENIENCESFENTSEKRFELIELKPSSIYKLGSSDNPKNTYFDIRMEEYFVGDNVFVKSDLSEVNGGEDIWFGGVVSNRDEDYIIQITPHITKRVAKKDKRDNLRICSNLKRGLFNGSNRSISTTDGYTNNLNISLETEIMYEKEILVVKKSIEYASIYGYSAAIYEIINQYYAYILINASRFKEFVKIPRIFKVIKDGNTITIIMEYIRINEIMKNKVILLPLVTAWLNTIHNVFEFLKDNGLQHLDTATRNFYFTKCSDELKLALIDFGQSRLIPSDTYAGAQYTGFPIRSRFISTEQDDLIRMWINGTGDNIDQKYGGRKTRRKSYKFKKTKRKSKRKSKRNRK